MLYQALHENSLKRSISSVPSGIGFANWFGGGSVTKNGTVVNNTSALTLSAFYNGVTILCNDFAKLPKHVVQKVNGDTIRLADHPVDYLINQRPNQYMNAFGYDSILMKCAILKGNGYAEKVVNPFSGKVESLQYIL
jgi:phage portal protein BeeE